MRHKLPTGTVTFLFTDIEGSTRLLRELGDGYAEVLAAHHRLLREVWSRHEGVEVGTAGDAFFVAFADVRAAVAAAAGAQAALAQGPLRVRMGLHTGAPLISETGYVGLDVHRAARIAAVANGGQVLISATTRALVDAELTDLGPHRLKDLAEPIRLFQLGDEEFPPLKSLYEVHLPTQVTPLIGRETEVEEIVARLGQTRLLTLTGPGGTGKTRLALHAAAELAEDYIDGVWWVSLAAVREPALVLPTIGSTIGAAEDIAAHVGDKRLLLLLDNLEQVIDAAPELGTLLAKTPNLKLLVTSRQPLRIAGEVEYDVPPLAEQEGVQLFVERARAVDASFIPNDHVAAICRRLDGLPLAIELAAARVRTLTSVQILGRLEQRLPFLTVGRRDAPHRHRTLRATIDWTYELLDADERSLFARLGVFHGGWSLAAAEQVVGATLEAVESLVEKSLVRRVGERFVMLETIREYAVGRLAETSDRGAVQLRHAQWVCELVEELERKLTTAEQVDATAAYRADLDNIRAAISFARAEVLRELESRLAGACWYFWYATSSFPEGRSVLSAAEQGDRFVPAAARAKVLEGLSAMESLTGDDGAAIGHAEEALEIRRRLGEPTGILRALVNAATASERGADPAGARARLEECRSLAEEVGDRWFFGIALVNLGSLALIRGDYLEAEQSLRASLAIWLELGDRLTGAAAETNLAAALLLQGHRDDALRRYRAVIDVWRELGATEGLVWCLEGLALAASDEDPQIAARIGGAVARACSDLGYTLPDQEEIWDERWRRVVQNRLGSDEIAACEAEGLQMTVDEAIDHALAAAARWNR